MTPVLKAIISYACCRRETGFIGVMGEATRGAKVRGRCKKASEPHK